MPHLLILRHGFGALCIPRCLVTARRGKGGFSIRSFAQLAMAKFNVIVTKNCELLLKDFLI